MSHKYKAVHNHKNGHDDYYFETATPIRFNEIGNLSEEGQQSLIRQLKIDFSKGLFGDTLEVVKLPDHFFKKVFKTV